LNWTFWSLNPDSGDTGGLLLDDWQSVHQDKQNALKTIQYPLIDSGLRQSPATAVPSQVPFATNPPLPERGSALSLDNFEAGLLQNWNSFRSNNSTIRASVVSPGQSGSSALRIDFNIGPDGWAGMEHLYSVPQYWRSFQSLSFGFYGMDSGATIRFEILDNRSFGSSTDTSERFEYKFIDNFNGWKTFTLPWNTFVRRLDWQPAGAPNDGFNLTTVWGFNVSPVSGKGSFQVDDIKLTNP